MSSSDESNNPIDSICENIDDGVVGKALSPFERLPFFPASWPQARRRVFGFLLSLPLLGIIIALALIPLYLSGSTDSSGNTNPAIIGIGNIFVFGFCSIPIKNNSNGNLLVDSLQKNKTRIEGTNFDILENFNRIYYSLFKNLINDSFNIDLKNFGFEFDDQTNLYTLSPILNITFRYDPSTNPLKNFSSTLNSTNIQSSFQNVNTQLGNYIDIQAINNCSKASINASFCDPNSKQNCSIFFCKIDQDCSQSYSSTLIPILTTRALTTISIPEIKITQRYYISIEKLCEIRIKDNQLGRYLVSALENNRTFVTQTQFDYFSAFRKTYDSVFKTIYDSYLENVDLNEINLKYGSLSYYILPHINLTLKSENSSKNASELISKIIPQQYADTFNQYANSNGLSSYLETMNNESCYGTPIKTTECNETNNQITCKNQTTCTLGVDCDFNSGEDDSTKRTTLITTRPTTQPSASIINGFMEINKFCKIPIKRDSNGSKLVEELKKGQSNINLPGLNFFEKLYEVYANVFEEFFGIDFQTVQLTLFEVDNFTGQYSITPFMNITFILKEQNKTVDDLKRKFNSSNIETAFIKFASNTGLKYYLDIDSINNCNNVTINIIVCNTTNSMTECKKDQCIINVNCDLNSGDDDSSKKTTQTTRQSTVGSTSKPSELIFGYLLFEKFCKIPVKKDQFGNLLLTNLKQNITVIQQTNLNVYETLEQIYQNIFSQLFSSYFKSFELSYIQVESIGNFDFITPYLNVSYGIYDPAIRTDYFIKQMNSSIIEFHFIKNAINSPLVDYLDIPKIFCNGTPYDLIECLNPDDDCLFSNCTFDNNCRPNLSTIPQSTTSSVTFSVSSFNYNNTSSSSGFTLPKTDSPIPPIPTTSLNVETSIISTSKLSAPTETTTTRPTTQTTTRIISSQTTQRTSTQFSSSTRLTTPSPTTSTRLMISTTPPITTRLTEESTLSESSSTRLQTSTRPSTPSTILSTTDSTTTTTTSTSTSTTSISTEPFRPPTPQTTTLLSSPAVNPISSSNTSPTTRLNLNTTSGSLTPINVNEVGSFFHVQTFIIITICRSSNNSFTIDGFNRSKILYLNSTYILNSELFDIAWRIFENLLCLFGNVAKYDELYYELLSSNGTCIDVGASILFRIDQNLTNTSNPTILQLYVANKFSLLNLNYIGHNITDKLRKNPNAIINQSLCYADDLSGTFEACDSCVSTISEANFVCSKLFENQKSKNSTFKNLALLIGNLTENLNITETDSLLSFRVANMMEYKVTCSNYSVIRTNDPQFIDKISFVITSMNQTLQDVFTRINLGLKASIGNILESVDGIKLIKKGTSSKRSVYTEYFMSSDFIFKKNYETYDENNLLLLQSLISLGITKTNFSQIFLGSPLVFGEFNNQSVQYDWRLCYEKSITNNAFCRLCSSNSFSNNFNCSKSEIENMNGKNFLEVSNAVSFVYSSPSELALSNSDEFVIAQNLKHNDLLLRYYLRVQLEKVLRSLLTENNEIFISVEFSNDNFNKSLIRTKFYIEFNNENYLNIFILQALFDQVFKSIDFEKFYWPEESLLRSNNASLRQKLCDDVGCEYCISKLGSVGQANCSCNSKTVKKRDFGFMRLITNEDEDFENTDSEQTTQLPTPLTQENKETTSLPVLIMTLTTLTKTSTSNGENIEITGDDESTQTKLNTGTITSTMPKTTSGDENENLDLTNGNQEETTKVTTTQSDIDEITNDDETTKTTSQSIASSTIPKLISTTSTDDDLGEMTNGFTDDQEQATKIETTQDNLDFSINDDETTKITSRAMLSSTRPTISTTSTDEFTDGITDDYNDETTKIILTTQKTTPLVKITTTTELFTGITSDDIFTSDDTETTKKSTIQTLIMTITTKTTQNFEDTTDIETTDLDEENEVVTIKSTSTRKSSRTDDFNTQINLTDDFTENETEPILISTLTTSTTTKEDEYETDIFTDQTDMATDDQYFDITTDEDKVQTKPAQTLVTPGSDKTTLLTSIPVTLKTTTKSDDYYYYDYTEILTSYYYITDPSEYDTDIPYTDETYDYDTTLDTRTTVKITTASTTITPTTSTTTKIIIQTTKINEQSDFCSLDNDLEIVVTLNDLVLIDFLNTPSDQIFPRLESIRLKLMDLLSNSLKALAKESNFLQMINNVQNKLVRSTLKLTFAGLIDMTSIPLQLLVINSFKSLNLNNELSGMGFTINYNQTSLIQQDFCSELNSCSKCTSLFSDGRILCSGV